MSANQSSISRLSSNNDTDLNTQLVWTAVDDYIEAHLIEANPILEKTLENTARQGYSSHLHIAPNQAKMLTMFIKMNGAKRILEFGTFAAYSTIVMAQALPEDGYILTIENRDTHHALAVENIENAGLSKIIDARHGRASDVLQSLSDDTPAFDFIFIDADKQSYPEYLELSLKLSRSGTIIIMDNVIRAADIIDPENQKPSIVGLRELFQALENHPQIAECTAIQTVGCKGYDGFAMAIVK